MNSITQLKQVNNKKLRDVEFSNALIPLGFAMEIPKGFKANLYPRSSTYKKWGIIFGNHVGQVDSSYRGNNDEWLVSAIALKATEIHAGDKIAQFEIVTIALILLATIPVAVYSYLLYRKKMG